MYISSIGWSVAGERRNHGQETKSESKTPKKPTDLWLQLQEEQEASNKEVESTATSPGGEEGDERLGRLTSRIKIHQVDEVETTD